MSKLLKKKTSINYLKLEENEEKGQEEGRGNKRGAKSHGRRILNSRSNQIHNLRQKTPVDYNNLNGTTSANLDSITSTSVPGSVKRPNTMATTTTVASTPFQHPNNLVINSDNHYERQYTCKRCGFFTNNPRAVLYHRRDFHMEKINVHECTYCQYASQYSGKVERHTLLRHKIDINTRMFIKHVSF